MFCPKCGSQNPETGKFCRSCGTDLGNVTQALSGKLPISAPLVDHKGKPVSYERAIMKLFTGVAFLVVAAALAWTGNGRGWWFWMLIPAFTSLGAGVAQYIQLRKVEKGLPVYSPQVAQPQVRSAQQQALPPDQTSYVAPESRFKTGDLVPPSVTDNTTRHLEMDSEGKTMALPKK
jgi:hypothetical protein